MLNAASRPGFTRYRHAIENVPALRRCSQFIFLRLKLRFAAYRFGLAENDPSAQNDSERNELTIPFEQLQKLLNIVFVAGGLNLPDELFIQADVVLFEDYPCLRDLLARLKVDFNCFASLSYPVLMSSRRAKIEYVRNASA